MVAPTYATDLTDINLVEVAGGTTGWTALGGGAAGLNSETDYFIQGNACLSKNGFTAATKGMIYDATTTTIAAGDAVFIWIKQNNRNLMDTIANGGSQVVIGSGTSAYDHFYIDGNDSEGSALAGWRTYAVDPTATPSQTTGSPTNTNFIGGLWKILGSGSLKGAPNGIDAFRHGRELTSIDGDVSNGFATFDGAATFDANTTRRWGILTPARGGYWFHGAFVMGTTATAVDFRDSARNIVVLDDPFVAAGFNEFEIRNASSNVEWTTIFIDYLGTVAKPVLTLNVGTFTGSLCRFSNCDTTVLASTGSMKDSTWVDCAQVTAPASDLRGSSILTSTVATDTGALLYNSATNPDGKLDNMTFSKGTNAHHAIDFGTSVTSDITLRGIEFTGFGSTADANDSTVRFLATSGALTLSLVGCTVDGSPATTSNFSVDDAAGITVTVSIDPVTTLVNVKDNTGANLINANVYLRAEDGTGDLPFEESVTITRAGTTATVSHTAHGLNNNEYVKIQGITDKTEDNAGAHQITVTDANTYTYQTTDSGSTNYTGTITSTGVTIYGLTDASGNISTSRTYGLAQPLTGFVRKSSASPRFKTFPISGTVNTSTGLTINVRLILDE